MWYGIPLFQIALIIIESTNKMKFSVYSGYMNCKTPFLKVKILAGFNFSILILKSLGITDIPTYCKVPASVGGLDSVIS